MIGMPSPCNSQGVTGQAPPPHLLGLHHYLDGSVAARPTFVQQSSYGDEIWHGKGGSFNMGGDYSKGEATHGQGKGVRGGTSRNSSDDHGLGGKGGGYTKNG